MGLRFRGEKGKVNTLENGTLKINAVTRGLLSIKEERSLFLSATSCPQLPVRLNKKSGRLL